MERAGAHPSAGALVSSLPSYNCQEEKKKKISQLSYRVCSDTVELVLNAVLAILFVRF